MAQKKCPPAGAPDWMVSYGDMMSLLLTFFIMLFAISSLDTSKADTVAIVMQDTFGTSRNLYVPIPGKEWERETGPQKNRSQTVNTIQAGNPTKASIPVHVPREKITTGVVVFDADSDTLTNEATQILQDVYNRVKGSPLMIELRGYTGLYEKGANRDSMDLGYARSHKVWEYLVNQGVDSTRILITSMGSNRGSNFTTSPQAGGSNAYVEILLISETPKK